MRPGRASRRESPCSGRQGRALAACRYRGLPAAVIPAAVTGPRRLRPMWLEVGFPGMALACVLLDALVLTREHSLRRVRRAIFKFPLPGSLQTSAAGMRVPGLRKRQQPAAVACSCTRPIQPEMTMDFSNHKHRHMQLQAVSEKRPARASARREWQSMPEGKVPRAVSAHSFLTNFHALAARR